MRIPDEVLEAVRLFNERAYYEAHDVFEEAWAGARGDRRSVLKALVKIAAGMYHLQTSGFVGAESLLAGGLELLRKLPPEARFVVLAPVFEPASRCLAKVRRLRSGGTAEWEDQDLPRLKLKSPAGGGREVEAMPDSVRLRAGQSGTGV